jgi:hypothetical protein
MRQLRRMTSISLRSRRISLPMLSILVSPMLLCAWRNRALASYSASTLFSGVTAFATMYDTAFARPNMSRNTVHGTYVPPISRVMSSSSTNSFPSFSPTPMTVSRRPPRLICFPSASSEPNNFCFST